MYHKSILLKVNKESIEPFRLEGVRSFYTDQ